MRDGEAPPRRKRTPLCDQAPSGYETQMGAALTSERVVPGLRAFASPPNFLDVTADPPNEL